MTPRISWNRWAALLLIAPAAAVYAGTSTTNFRLKGNTVTATYEAFDQSDPCLLNLVSVTASDIVEKPSPGGKKGGAPGTVLGVFQRDVCTDTPLFEGVGGPASHSFQVAGDL